MKSMERYNNSNSGFTNEEYEHIRREVAESAYQQMGFSEERSRHLADSLLERKAMYVKKNELSHHDESIVDQEADILSMYMYAFADDQLEEEKISHLAHLFQVPETDVIQILREASLYKKSNWSDKQKYLNQLTTDELDRLYKVLVRHAENSATVLLRKKIEQIVADRVLSEQLFTKTADVLAAFHQQSDIDNWSYFELDFGTTLPNKEQLFDKIKLHIPGYLSVSGFYAIYNGTTCLYIGTGRIIWERIKAHYLASQGADTATRWVNFFSRYKKNLTIYWKPIALEMPEPISRAVRELMEAILQHRYEPLFEQFDGINP